MDDSARSDRRRRALRAARAVTLSLALGASAAGCSMAHAPDGDAGPEPVDSGTADAGHDAGPIDCTTSEWWNSQECCEMNGGFWTEGGGCAVPGPFVPPDLPA